MIISRDLFKIVSIFPFLLIFLLMALLRGLDDCTFRYGKGLDKFGDSARPEVIAIFNSLEIKL